MKCQKLDHLNDHHGRNNLLATYVHFQALVLQEDRLFGTTLHRPLSVPPQRKCNRSKSQPEVHAETLEKYANNSCLKGANRSNSVRGDGVESPSLARHSQRKLLHEEIVSLWVAMHQETPLNLIFPNAWYRCFIKFDFNGQIIIYFYI